jgi:hypothetical protein
MEALFGRCARLIRDWKMLGREVDVVKLEDWAQQLE